MSYDWTKKDDEETDRPARAEKIPAGQPDVTITKVIYPGTGKFTGKTRNGDYQIMPIIADEQGRELPLVLTLSEKAAWVLKRILEAAGADLARMNELGIEPIRFVEPAFGDANLIGRKFKVQVDYDEKGFAHVTPLRAAPVVESEEGEEEIPF